jgi:hypothetical protein
MIILVYYILCINIIARAWYGVIRRDCMTYKLIVSYGVIGRAKRPKVVFMPALMATPVVGERPSRSGEVVVPSDRWRACSSSHTRLHDWG